MNDKFEKTASKGLINLTIFLLLERRLGIGQRLKSRGGNDFHELRGRLELNYKVRALLSRFNDAKM